MNDPGHILIVDDNKANLALLSATFIDEGFKVNTASSVNAAQTFLSQSPNSVDLILSDILMPGQSGFDLVSWLKSPESAFSDIPILLITSKLPEPHHRVKGLALGAVDYLLRSLSSEEIVLRVRHAMEHCRQLMALKENLSNAESQAGLARVLAASNHEVKNLAMIICATANLSQKILKSVNPDPMVLNKAISGLVQSAELLAEVTRAMGRFAVNEQIEVTAVDGAKLIEEVASLVRVLVKGTLIVLDPYEGATPPLVAASPSHLKQVFINLFLNAADAIEEMAPLEGGLIRISIEEDEKAQAMTLCIKDNGVGFHEAGTKTEFKAFATTKQLRGGKGLGLWLCSRFVTAMGGSLSVSSQGPGQGAKVLLRLRKASQTA